MPCSRLSGPAGRPVTDINTLQVHVSALRRLLGAEVVVRSGRGYRLALSEDQIDAHEFVSRLGEAESFTDPKQRSDRLAAALGLWRGGAYAGFEELDTARAESVRLEALRLVALERRLGADLECGRAGMVAAELERLVAEHPMRERFWAMLMLAHYRSGRVADALSDYQRARRVLVSELGVEPGPELRDLESAVLRRIRRWT